MKYIISLILFITIFSNCSAQQNYRDVIYLKNGSIIKGIIVEQIPNVSLKIQTRDGSVFVFEMEQVEKMTKEKMDDEVTVVKNEKSMTTAFLLSFIFPGGGQYYNGQTSKGIIQTGLYITGMAFFIVKSNPKNSISQSGRELSYIGLFTAMGSSIWSMIDAPVSADNINEENRKERSNSFGHLFEYKLGKQTVAGIDPACLRNGTGISLTVHF